MDRKASNAKAAKKHRLKKAAEKRKKEEEEKRKAARRREANRQLKIKWRTKKKAQAENETFQTPGRGLLIILTLRKHANGVWITKLVERLKESVPNSSSFRNIEIGIRTLEDWLAEGWLISEEAEEEGVNYHGIIGIVNRVSDAASPALFKACCALLAAAEQSLKIKVFNGSKAYSLCGNKWRHHLLFRQAKLSAPKTMVYYTGNDGRGGEKTISIDTQIFQRNNKSGSIEVLVKPNAGGFGAGIRKISLPLPSICSKTNDATNSSPVRRTAEIAIPSSFEDGMALVQQYEMPIDGNIYRVWFLNGRVQCGVKRKVKTAEEIEEGNKNGVSSSVEFTSGCAGGNSCKFRESSYGRNAITSSSSNGEMVVDNNSAIDSSLSKVSPSLASTAIPSNLIPWEVPEEVRQEIEDQLLPLLMDAHCGSVEFMYASSTLQKREYSMSSSIGGNVDTTWEKSKSEVSNQPMIRALDGEPRLYFDLNLLSTLPITDTMNAPAVETVWSKEYDPWLELAHSIWKFCTKADGHHKRS